MQLVVAALCVSGASAGVARLGHSALRSRSAALLGASHRGSFGFGSASCPCVGFSNIEGETVVAFVNGSQAVYPADLGAHCEAWDAGRHPECGAGGGAPSWCAQPWCYVDPCNCRIPVLPKVAGYVPEASFQGKPVFYSYATCGGRDTYTEGVPEVGTSGCRCIGFDDIPGTVDIRLKDRDGKQSLVSYPAEVGGTCRAWDKGMHPMCTGDDPPKWCAQRWCYVNPCSCSLATKPKVTMYLPDATFTGMSLYYSYETCESKDYFTAKYNLEACVNQLTKDKCLSLKVKRGGNKCAWTGKSCLGWEIVEHPLCTKLVKTVDDTSRSGSPPSRRLAMAALAAAVGLLVA